MSGVIEATKHSNTGQECTVDMAGSDCAAVGQKRDMAAIQEALASALGADVSALEQPEPKRQAQEQCEICGESLSKYCCPKCKCKTCSLECVKKHKDVKSCDGKRDRLGFVPLTDFNDRHLVSDYRLLEEISRADDVAKRHRPPAPKAQLPPALSTLVYQADRRKIKLMLMSPGMHRRKNNTTRYDSRNRRLNWRVEWVFPSATVVPTAPPPAAPAAASASAGASQSETPAPAVVAHVDVSKNDSKAQEGSSAQQDGSVTVASDNVHKVIDTSIPEEAILSQVLEKHITYVPGSAVKQFPLAQYSDAGVAQLKVFMKKEGTPANAPLFYAVDITRPLGSQLAGKVVVEFPVLIVALPGEEHKYPSAFVKRPGPYQGRSQHVEQALQQGQHMTSPQQADGKQSTTPAVQAPAMKSDQGSTAGTPQGQVAGKAQTQAQANVQSTTNKALPKGAPISSTAGRPAAGMHAGARGAVQGQPQQRGPAPGPAGAPPGHMRPGPPPAAPPPHYPPQGHPPGSYPPTMPGAPGAPSFVGVPAPPPSHIPPPTYPPSHTHMPPPGPGPAPTPAPGGASGQPFYPAIYKEEPAKTAGSSSKYPSIYGTGSQQQSAAPSPYPTITAPTSAATQGPAPVQPQQTFPTTPAGPYLGTPPSGYGHSLQPPPHGVHNPAARAGQYGRYGPGPSHNITGSTGYGAQPPPTAAAAPTGYGAPPPTGYGVPQPAAGATGYGAPVPLPTRDANEIPL